MAEAVEIAASGGDPVARMKGLKVLVLIALCTGGMAAWAQTIEKEKVDTALTAEITLVDTIARTLALEGANGERSVVGIDDKTTIMSGAKKVGLEGLHKGEWVTIDVDRRGDRLVATYVEVVDDPSDAESP
jgi:hypothetical protein